MKSLLSLFLLSVHFVVCFPNAVLFIDAMANVILDVIKWIKPLFMRGGGGVRAYSFWDKDHPIQLKFIVGGIIYTNLVSRCQLPRHE